MKAVEDGTGWLIAGIICVPTLCVGIAVFCAIGAVREIGRLIQDVRNDRA